MGIQSVIGHYNPVITRTICQTAHSTEAKLDIDLRSYV